MVGFKLALAHPRISDLFKFYPTFRKIWQTCCKKIKETELLEYLVTISTSFAVDWSSRLLVKYVMVDLY